MSNINTDEKKPFATYYKQLGRYNLCSNEKSWCLQLFTSEGNFSELFSEADEPDVSDWLPSEVLELIENRLDSYLFKTSREETKKRIAKAREKLKDLDLAWLYVQLDIATKRVNQISNRIADVVDSE